MEQSEVWVQIERIRLVSLGKCRGFSQSVVSKSFVLEQTYFVKGHTANFHYTVMKVRAKTEVGKQS